jgi:cytochrome c biogenesis protein CcmG, thiol:disulfide interchange protein DsbE
MAQRSGTKGHGRKQSNASRTGGAGRNLPVFPMVVGVVLLLGVVAVVLSMGDDGGGDEATEVAPVSVEGGPLPAAPSEGADGAVGHEIPIVSGVGWDDQPVRIEPDGEPMAIVLLAHWCPHCQVEVTEMSEWLAEEGMPEGVTLRAVSTLTDRQRPNYPPSQWLEREEWPVPTVMDDGESTVAEAYGLTATPYWVFADADGEVVARVSGRIPIDTLSEMLEALAAGELGS